MRKASAHVLHVKKGFNDNDVRYMCCRNKYHLRKAAIIVGGIELGAVGVAVVYCIVSYFMDGFYKTTTPMKLDPSSNRRSLLILALAMSIITLVIWSIVFGLTVFGIKKLRPALLIPHMMIQVLAIVSLAGLSALFIWWAIDVNDESSRSTAVKPRIPYGKWDQDFRADRDNVLAATIVFSVLATASVLTFFTEIFFFLVVRRCYKYLRAKINYQLQVQQQQRKQSQGNLKPASSNNDMRRNSKL